MALPVAMTADRDDHLLGHRMTTDQMIIRMQMEILTKWNKHHNKMARTNLMNLRRRIMRKMKTRIRWPTDLERVIQVGRAVEAALLVEDAEAHAVKATVAVGSRPKATVAVGSRPKRRDAHHITSAKFLKRSYSPVLVCNCH